jgi:phosphatidylinositol glycan class Z
MMGLVEVAWGTVRRGTSELRAVGRAYRLLLLLRAVVALAPWTTGYIHPDEHFQSTEVAVGAALGLDTWRTWEWDPSRPLRSPALPLLLYGLPALLLRGLNSALRLLLGGDSLLTPAILQAVARLPLLPLSLTTDLAILHLSRHLKLATRPLLLLLASSHLLLTYATRPLANSLELAFTSILLSLTLPPRPFATTVLPLGLICALGTFNRPTFGVFAAAPLLSWLLRGVSSPGLLWPALARRLPPLALATLLPATVILLCDSLYFGQLAPTPWNFLAFNLAPGGAAQFGKDPRFTHLLVNLPILFGPLALLPWLAPRTLAGGHRPLLLSLLLPLLAFSLVDHQEPRFLLPLLPSVLLLLGPYALSCRHFTPLWIVFNLTMGIFWSFLNQAGLTPLLAAVPGLAGGAPRVELLLPWAWPAPRLPLLPRGPRYRLHPECGQEAAREATLEQVVTALSTLACQPDTLTMLGLPAHLLPALRDRAAESGLRAVEVATFWPHLALESLFLSLPQPLSPLSIAGALLPLLSQPSQWAAPSPGILTLSLLNVTKIGGCIS